MWSLDKDILNKAGINHAHVWFTLFSQNENAPSRDTHTMELDIAFKCVSEAECYWSSAAWII
jgi:hypothetical protein